MGLRDLMLNNNIVVTGTDEPIQTPILDFHKLSLDYEKIRLSEISSKKQKAKPKVTGWQKRIKNLQNSRK